MFHGNHPFLYTVREVILFRNGLDVYIQDLELQVPPAFRFVSWHFSRHVMKDLLTWPHALQLCFFLIIENGCPHSMHLVAKSNFLRWGCLRPISASKGLNMDLPIRSEDLRLYNSLIVQNRLSNQRSFSSRVLQLKGDFISTIIY